jgi:antitoxin component of MazEF toxin-antitoxin module
LAVIIPKEILEETGAKEGDIVKLSVPIPRRRQREVLQRMAGIDAGSRPFTREKRDRI